LGSAVVDCTSFDKQLEFDQSQQKNLDTLFLYHCWEDVLVQVWDRTTAVHDMLVRDADINPGNVLRSLGVDYKE
jgi:hypothetical protein